MMKIHGLPPDHWRDGKKFPDRVARRVPSWYQGLVRGRRTLAKAWIVGVWLVGAWSVGAWIVLACSTDAAAPANHGTRPTGDTTATSGPATTTTGATGTTGPGRPIDPGPQLDCGQARFPEGTGLRRRPYLQSVEDTSASVVWTTTTGGLGLVRFGPGPDGPWVEVDADTQLFETVYTQDTEDYFAYEARLTGLSPNAAYCYEVVEDGTVVAAGLLLHTAWRSEDRPVRILAFGDSGTASPEQLALRDQMLTRQFDVFLHLGDMAYGEGTFVEFEERVFDVYRGLLHRVPTYPTIGNHEYKTDEAQPYLDVYHLWEMALRQEDQERYYSFDYGPIHFISLDSNPEIMVPIIFDAEGVVDDDMLDWLEADLAATDKPWKIAFFHHPPYTSSERAPNYTVRQGILPTLEAGGVDLVLAGHDHHYERSVPIKDGRVGMHSDGAIVYFVIGSGGAGLRTATGDWWTDTVNDRDHAFLELTVHGCTATGTVIGMEGQTLDQFELDGC